MRLEIYQNLKAMSIAAAEYGAQCIAECIEAHGIARIVLSTGASQLAMLEHLTQKNISWDKVEAFHLDEYCRLSYSHRASFRKYLKERFVDIVHPRHMHFVNTEAEDLDKTLAQLADELRKAPLHIGFIGIGENAHIAFNDPPADFDNLSPYAVVDLSPECKAQQVREGWFASELDVPAQAVSMTVRQIMACDRIISCVPGIVKAKAILATLTSQTVTPEIPATMLKRHPDVALYLDCESASLLPEHLTTGAWRESTASGSCGRWIPAANQLGDLEA